MAESTGATTRFQRCLNPHLLLMRLAGVDLFPPDNSASQTVWTVYGFAILSLNLGCCVYSTYEVFIEFFNYLKQVPPATSWSTYVDVAVFYFLTAVTHTVLLFSSRSRIQKLWTSVNKAITFIPRNDDIWRKLHWNSIKAVTVITVSDSTYLLWGVFSAEHSLVEQTIRIVVLASHRLLTKSCILYVILGFGFVSLFERINEEVRKSDEDLLKWYKIHAELCSSVDLLVDTFRFVLLFSTAQTFFMAITTSFQVFLQISGASDDWGIAYTLWYAAEVVEFLVLFWVICYTSDLIRRKAKKVLNTIYKLELQFALGRGNAKSAFLMHSQTKCNSFLHHAYNNIPSLNILGLFQLSQSLIPTLIGTLLTYSVILWQFRAP